MPDPIPAPVLAAATAAIRDQFRDDLTRPGSPEPDALARAALEAAVPLLADKIASAILRHADENEPGPGSSGYLAWHHHFEAASAVAAKAFGRDNLEVPSGAAPAETGETDAGP
jgi:hypothetical protein